jgi:hypothetical protein
MLRETPTAAPNRAAAVRGPRRTRSCTAALSRYEAVPPAVGPTGTAGRARAAGATRRRMHISPAAPPAAASLIDMPVSPSQWTVDGSSRNSEQAPGVESKSCLPSTPSRFNTRRGPGWVPRPAVPRGACGRSAARLPVGVRRAGHAESGARRWRSASCQ